MTAPAHPGDRRVDPSRRQLLFGGALVATSAIAVAATPRAEPPLLGTKSLDDVIPTRFGDWRYAGDSAFVLPPRDETEARTYDQVLTRLYSNAHGGPPVMLVIAYGGGQTGLFEIHRPEACYPAQGYALTDRSAIQVPVAPGTSLEATFWSAASDVRVEQLLYWTRIGRFFPRTWAAEHLAIIRSNIVRTLPDGVLVRMSIASTDRAASIVRLEQFAGAFAAGVGPLARRIVFGDLGSAGVT